MIGTMDCAALHGFGAIKIRVEVDISRGIPAFQLVGLAENSVKEARVRVQSAINNAGFDFPRAKISVNLAPADLQKNGTSFDLAIALAILQASGVIPKEKLRKTAAIGELSLTGEIRPVRGMLALAECIKEQGFNAILVTKENAQEACLINGLSVREVSNFKDMVKAILSDQLDNLPIALPEELALDSENYLVDMKDVVGQEEARRALLIAAAGNHNLLFIGGPGSGKSMMANRLPTILPHLSYKESMMLTKIYSIAGLTMSGNLINRRPFRAPHHSITKAGLVGGGSKFIRPGEISLSCFGVLFLDELLEFPRTVLEVLRQPLEDGKITLSRASQSITFPAEFSLVGALNPCPCGNFGQGKAICICSPSLVARYKSRLSGPLTDRIDLHVNVGPVNLKMMNYENKNETSLSMKNRVIAARLMQEKRFKVGLTNSKMTRRHIREYSGLTNNSLDFLLKCCEKLSVSARAFDRIIKVSRTIADLDESKNIYEHHVAEALHYRP
jgi:magnesium chelatase family protein